MNEHHHRDKDKPATKRVQDEVAKKAYAAYLKKLPADGVIVDGENSVNEAMLTGESAPVTKKTGGKVISGSINGGGSLTIEVKGAGKDSFLSQVIDLVKQAQESKAKTQDLANTAAVWLTIVALSCGAITELASARLNVMNVRFKSRLPWAVAFSFGRTIQQPALEIWQGEEARVSAAQQALYHRAWYNRAARHGEYTAALERT